MESERFILFNDFKKVASFKSHEEARAVIQFVKPDSTEMIYLAEYDENRACKNIWFGDKIWEDENEESEDY